MNIWMIVLSNDPTSQYYSEMCLDQWHRLGYNIIKKEGTTPDNLGTELRFAERKFNGNRFTDIEKAIWYSHFNIWKEVREPTYIIEHDTYPYKKLPKFSRPVGLFSTFPRNDEAWQKKREVISPGSGYYVTRTTASVLMEWAKAKPITENVDGHIHQTVKSILNQSEEEFNDYHLENATCFQVVNYAVGTSAEHNK